MYNSNDIYKEEFYQSKILNTYFDNLNIGIVDIETTGLNPDRSRFILGGLVVPDSQGKKAIQLLSESKEEEGEVLHAYLSEMKDLDILITYNGDHFDLPFLGKRISYNRIPREVLPTFQSIDLYRILDRHSTLRKLLPNLKQKTVETFLGLWSDRADEISGAESVELYNRYVRTGDLSLRDTILLHNKDDILQLSRLMKVFEKLDIHKIMYHTGFIVSHLGKKIYIKSIELKKDSIFVTGKHKNIPIDYRCYLHSHEAQLSVKTGIFSLRIPWQNAKNYTYIDLEEFSWDLSALEKYAGYQSGYLLISQGDEINYAELNHLIKLVIKEILKEL
jgi:uncharacterized protein YprB with RNaseH-like and TPR domain